MEILTKIKIKKKLIIKCQIKDYDNMESAFIQLYYLDFF